MWRLHIKNVGNNSWECKKVTHGEKIFIIYISSPKRTLPCICLSGCQFSFLTLNIMFQNEVKYWSKHYCQHVCKTSQDKMSDSVILPLAPLARLAKEANFILFYVIKCLRLEVLVSFVKKIKRNGKPDKAWCDIYRLWYYANNSLTL